MLTWILQHLHIIMPMLAVTAMPSLGGGEAAGAIINSDPGSSEVDTSTGDGVDTGETTETDDGGETDEGSGEGQETQTTQPKEGQVDWRTVPAEVKSHIQEIAKTNPKLANLLQNAVYTSNNFLKEVPGGIKEIKQLKADIDSLGGMEEIRELSTTHKALVDEQEVMDTQAREGNPEIINNLIEIAGNDGFSKLMPHTLAKWASIDGPGYSHEMSKIMVNAMRDGGMVANLNMAFKLLKLGNPEAIKEATECLNAAAVWANDIHKLANTAPQKPKVDPQIAEEQRKINDQKAQLFNENFSNTFGRWRSSEITREVSQIVGNGKNLNDYQMKTLTQRVVDDMKDILMSDRDYMKNLERLYNARNMDDLLKFAKNRVSKLLPDVTKKAYRSLFSNPGAPKKTATTKPNTQAAKPGTSAAKTATPTSWTKIEASKAPKPEDIDSRKTTFEMKFRKQAILKNGQRVYWGSQVPR